MYRKLHKSYSSLASSRYRFALATALCLALSAVGLSLVPASYSASPAGATVSETNPKVTWTGAAMAPNAPNQCDKADNPACDNFKLTIQAPPASFGPYIVQIKLVPQGDWDMQIFGPSGAIVDGSGNGTGVPEIVTLVNPPGGTYTVAANPFTPLVGTDGTSYAAQAELRKYDSTYATSGADTVRYQNFQAPSGMGRDSGEPSIGVNWKTGRAMFIAGLETLRITFDDTKSPTKATWEDKSFPSTATVSLDPILFTDHQTGRTFVSQLISGAILPVLEPFGCSLTAYTDDDGETWIQSEGCGLPTSGSDHQSIGGGPFASPLTRDPSLPAPYSNAVYYCAQNELNAFCSVSMDGGQTFGPGVMIYVNECGGLHGHPQVSPKDGTVYVPNKGCGGEQAVVYSEDNGVSWKISQIPDSLAASNDPGVAIGANGTVYFGYQNADGHPRVAVGHKTASGITWETSKDVGGSFGINNTAFPRVVAGDDDRAAFAFLGTPTAGPFQDASFQGEWHLYLAHTFDGGKTWTTVDATPGDPVQRGCIWMQGGTNQCRNLLDFMGSAVDKEGRVLIGYADGCVGTCVTGTSNSYTKIATIARQSGGKRLFAAYDPIADPSPTPTPDPTPTPVPTPRPNVLHLHGNPSDDPQCTGVGTADVVKCGGPFLLDRSTLGTGPAAHWEPEIAHNGTADQNIYDPSWIWNLDQPTTLSGPMKLQWWASCSGCSSGISDANWKIRLWADGVKVFETTVTSVTPALPNVPQLLEATVNVPAIKADSKFVLHIDPVFIDSQTVVHIFYDSQSPCPGATGTAPCDSKVTMPIVDPYATPTPTPTPTSTPVPVIPVYQKGGITFSANVALRAPVAGRDGEPSLRVDKFGNAYVAGIRGVPAGVDLWYFDLNPNSPTYDPLMRNPIYRGQPDQFSPDESIEVGADGGGDVDLAVGFDEASPGNPPYLAFSSLVAANVSTARSTDRGASFTKNPAGNVTGGIPADDRQWMEFYGKNSVYLLYRTLDPVIAFVQRSDDGGLTYGPAREVGSIGQVGGISVDQTDGTVYVGGNNGVVAVGTPAAPGQEPTSYTIHNVAGAGKAHLFFTVKAAKDGTVYVCYSDDHNVFIQYSKDKGNTWSQPVRVSDGPETATSIVPWMETGPAAGSIGVVWYGTDSASNNDNANWKVFFAQSLNATDASPVFRQVTLSDHFIHGSNISEGGLPTLPGAAPNRNLLDYFQIGFDPTGAAVVAYTDDHNDYDGNTYVARQTSGPGVKGTSIPAPIEGVQLPKPIARDPNGPQVLDFAQDAKTGLLTVLPVNDPLDILSVKYSVEPSASGPVLVTSMKVSDLSIVPPLSNWRMSFAANAPDSRLSPTGDYTFGLSDRGDQFFLRATTDALGTRTFTYGTAVREHQHRGFVAYTDKGTADGGSFDQATNTITIKVSLSKLNGVLPAGHAPVGPGSILVGLRGNTYTTGDDNAADRNDRAKSDVTRGGTQYTIDSPPTAALSASPTTGPAPFVVNFDASASGDPDPGDTLTYTFDFGDGSAPVTQSSPTVSHTYSQIGKYTASLTVKDTSGFTSANTATVDINVINRPPTAALTASPTSGYAPFVVNFDGSQSSDPDQGDSVSSYMFDFGDGSIVTQSGAKIAHTYTAAGIYTATLKVIDTRGDASTNPASVKITVNSRPTSECMDDDDSRIAYSDGWHLGNSVSASGGHFRWHTGKSQNHSASVTFAVPANSTGSFVYRYAKSTKGGTAEVFIDGVSRGTINYKGSTGSDKSPEFGSGGAAYQAQYDGLTAGQHTFALRNMADSVFIDGFCLNITTQPQPVQNQSATSGGTTTTSSTSTTSQSSFSGSPSSGPGQTSSNDSSVSAGQESNSSLSLPTNATAVSIVAESSGGLPVKLVLLNPTGLAVQTADAVNGVAVLTAPVSQGGLYTIKVVNVGLGPVQVWTVATPTIQR